jgi:RNA polymerase sigma factor FliA
VLDQQIVASYGWARNYALRCTAIFSKKFDREELTSAGVLGYILAARRYNQCKGSSFRGFCAIRIRGAIVDEYRKLTGEPRSSGRSRKVIATKKLELEAILQRSPSDLELAEALGLEASEFSKMQRASQPLFFLCLDEESASEHDDQDLPLREVIADKSTPSPSDSVDSAEIRRALCASISKLPPVEANIIISHYLHGVTLHDIAGRMNMTPARISQLHHRAISSLKKHLAKKNPELF